METREEIVSKLELIRENILGLFRPVHVKLHLLIK